MNLFPTYSGSYITDFDCGTGLGYTSLLPFETFRIEKSYTQIVKEASYFTTLLKADFIADICKKYDVDIIGEELDSLIRAGAVHVLDTDSVEIEYYVPLNSYFSKNSEYSVSNRINVSMKDLINAFTETCSVSSTSPNFL